VSVDRFSIRGFFYLVILFSIVPKNLADFLKIRRATYPKVARHFDHEEMCETYPRISHNHVKPLYLFRKIKWKRVSIVGVNGLDEVP